MIAIRQSASKDSPSILGLDALPVASLAQIKAVFFDIDDTFSTHGRIHADAYQALWSLHEAGLVTVPVTGRPAGWCDFFARMWPITAVVGENGAFYSMMRGGKLVKTYLEAAPVRRRHSEKLMRLRRSIEKAFPGVRFASDQAFREFDLAIDYCEDVKAWPEAKVTRLLDFSAARGAQAKLSSIHVNTWFGRYDKWTCVKKVMKDVVKLNPLTDLDQVVYLGDSPNDEPFFERLPLTVGVANVRKFLPRMKSQPTYIAAREGGSGFADFVEKLLAAR